MANEKQKDDVAENAAALNKFYHEFYPLIPGFLFFGCLALLFLGFYCFYEGRFPANTMFTHDSWPLFAFVALFLIFGSFVAGNVFNRLSPKDPDIFGVFHHNWQRKHSKTANDFRLMANLSTEALGKKHHLPFFSALKLGFLSFSGDALRRKIDPNAKMQFPYPHVRPHLSSNNHGKLLRFVSWCYTEAGIQDTEGSKLVINGLKHRILEINDPDVNLKLVQEECQIRLMTSMWHVLRVVRVPVAAFLAATFVSTVLKFCDIYKGEYGFAKALIPENGVLVGDIVRVLMPKSSLPCCLLILLAGVYGLYIYLRAKYELEYSVYYMRQREVFDVLDYAYLLSCKEANSGRFASLSEKAEAFAARCKGCAANCKSRVGPAEKAGEGA